MKRFSIVSTALLFLLLGTGVSVYAQDPHDDAKPQAQEGEKAKQEEVKPAAKPADDKNVKREEAKNRQEKQDEKSRQDEAKTVQSDRRVEASHAEPRGRIPEDKFRAHFGREHTFQIGHPVIVEGRPHFQYGGYRFVMVDPWPVGWAYSDAVYIDFIDGVYYLIDPVHPGVQIVINIM